MKINKIIGLLRGKQMDKRSEVDFGFSFADETDLANKEYEKELEGKLVEADKVVKALDGKVKEVDLTASVYKKRLYDLNNLIMPLLSGLTKEPEKKVLLWPQRAHKARELMKRCHEIVDGK